MPRFPKFLLLLVALLWLPASLHCAVESAGLLDRGADVPGCCTSELPSEHSTDSDSDADHGCVAVGCITVQNGAIKDFVVEAKAPAPREVLWFLAAHLTRPETEPLRVRPREDLVASDRTELPNTWQFTSRSAQAPRAPSGRS